jgi:type II secretory pathway component PulF
LNRNRGPRTAITNRRIVVRDDRLDFDSNPKTIATDVPRIRLIVHGVAWGLFLALLAFVVPRVEAIFADFGMPLPRVTTLALRASHHISTVVAIVIAMLTADYVVSKARSVRNDEDLSKAWSALMLALPLALIAVTLGALVLPLMTIMTPLSG